MEYVMSGARETIKRYLSRAGITVNGQMPWDIKVYHEGFYSRVLSEGALGLGESYMDGWWEVKQLDEFVHRILRARLDDQVHFNWNLALNTVVAKLVNLQTPSKSFVVGRRHYDLGNDLFCAMLDKGMTYSCGYWQHASTLDEAQEAKLELVCQKIGLQPGMRVLDIGCGWGSFARYAAGKYNAQVVGITVSKEQFKGATAACAGLPVTILLQDYRDIEGRFDRIVSIGMFEHVGHKNHRAFLELVSNHLVDDGLFLLHTIGSNEPRHAPDPWIAKYIFPNSQIPTMAEVALSSDGLFVMEDWHNFSSFYDQTLMAWYRNFENHWPALHERYDERFYRMWKYYLLACAGSFRARRNQLWQIVFSRHGIPGGFESIRENVVFQMAGAGSDGKGDSLRHLETRTRRN